MEIKAESPKVICRVKALYSFSSSEKSSLSFQKGDEIEVLSQLDTGWWDGWCKGRRGWFPSNYVDIIDINPELIENMKSPTKSRTNSMSSSVDRVSITPRKKKTLSAYRKTPPQPFPEDESFYSRQKSLPEGWILRIAEDGVTEFYHNQYTGGLRWTHPGIEDSDDDTEDDYYEMPRNQSQPRFESDNEDTTTHESFEDYQDFGKVKKKDTASTLSLEAKDIDKSNVMAYWSKRTTPQGKVYYGNSITQETTWDYEDIDKSTGKLRRKSSTESERSSKLVTSAEIIEETPLSWKSVAIKIAQGVQDLNTAAVRGEGAAFKQKISVIVDAVRLMLYSSRSMDKEAPHLQSPEMREPHRHVLTSLSKLILSAKVVNDSPVISANHVHSKVQRDAAELSNAVKKFIQQCQIKNVVIEPVNPRLIELEKENEQVEIEHRTQNTNTSEPTTTISEPTTVEEKRKSDSIPTAKGPVKTKYVLNQDLLVSIQTHAKQIMGTTNALCDASTNIYNIEMDQLISSNNNPDNDAVSEISADMKTEEEKLYMGHRARSCVVFLFQNLSIQVSQYISILGDIDLSKVDSTQIPTLPEFRLSKQKLYNSVGLLFSAVQTLTDVNLDLRSSVEAVDESLKRVEDAIDNIHSNLHQMVTERKMWLRKNESLVNSAAATIDESDGTHSPIHTYFESSTTAMNEGLAKAAAPGYSRSHRGSVNEHEQLSDNGSKSKRLMPNLSQHRPSISLSNGRSGDGSKPLKRQQSYGPQHHGGHHKIDEEYWYLGYDYSEGDIEFTQEKTIKGGTLAGLVERLTLHDYIDMSFIANFLLTYRSFCTTDEFIDLLQKRYNLSPPSVLTPDELEIWTEKKQKLVRLRVCNVMKNWLENYYTDEDARILDKLSFFNNTVISDSSSFSALQLTRLIQKRREVEDDASGLKKLIPNEKTGPIPVLPKNLNLIKLFDVDPLEMARQLTITDYELYSSIQPIECLRKAWSCEGAEGDIAINVKQSIDYCNKLTAWVTGSILFYKESKKRAIVIKHWSLVATRCLDMNNYNTCMAILSAFDNSSVGRLKKTWELVSSRTCQTLAQIRKLMGSNRNFTEYREMIHSVNPPCIPFLGIYLQDLTFIEDGNPHYLRKNSNLINFAKQQKSAEVIREIKQFQSPGYIFQPVKELQEFIKYNLDNSKDVDALYERSLEIEPRVPVESVA